MATFGQGIQTTIITINTSTTGTNTNDVQYTCPTDSVAWIYYISTSAVGTLGAEIRRNINGSLTTVDIGNVFTTNEVPQASLFHGEPGFIYDTTGGQDQEPDNVLARSAARNLSGGDQVRLNYSGIGINIDYKIIIIEYK